MKLNTRLTIYCVAVSLPLALLATSVVRTNHVLLVLSHYFGGRAGNCTLADSFEGEALSRLQVQNTDAVRASSRVIRKDDRYAVWSSPYGEFWMATASGDALIYDLAEQERNIYGNGVHPGDVVLDAGANVGVFTRKALWAGASKVVAIEPAPENLECLRRNFAAEIADGRVVLYPKGVWDKDDILKLRVDPNDSARDTFVRQIDDAQFIEAPLTTVDKMVVELQLRKVDFIKMDIEGAEQKAIIGARNTIAKFRPRMALCIYHVKGDETMVTKLVHDAVSDYKVSQTCLCAVDQVQPQVAFFN
jgi:FkbM family methyltransferase